MEFDCSGHSSDCELRMWKWMHAPYGHNLLGTWAGREMEEASRGRGAAAKNGAFVTGDAEHPGI